jgi:hypothetical protein
MEIIFRAIYNQPDETELGHKIWHRESLLLDAVSATANTGGFTPLTAIARFFDWDRDLINAASSQCNAVGQIAVIKEVNPLLLLVPKTDGRKDETFLINDLIAAANATSTEVLSFTHFGFIQNKLPELEIRSILGVLMNPDLKTTIRVLVWDIDLRHRVEMMRIYDEYKKKVKKGT